MGRLVGNYRRAHAPFTPFHPLHAIDVGAYYGHSSLDLLRGGGIVHAIAEWSPEELKTFCSRFNKRDLFRKVFIYAGRHLNYAKIWPWQVDLVFLNVSRSFPETSAAIAAWSKFVRPGGIMAGFGIDEPAVERAVQSAIGFHGRCGGAIWFKEFEKKD